jgi:uncharacterized membrane protein
MPEQDNEERISKRVVVEHSASTGGGSNGPVIIAIVVVVLILLVVIFMYMNKPRARRHASMRSRGDVIMKIGMARQARAAVSPNAIV